MELKILSPQDTHCLRRCGAGQGFIIRAAPLGNIYGMSATGTGWIIDISFCPDCPRRRHMRIPRERGETGTEGVITHNPLPTTAAHKSPTIKSVEAADAAVAALE